MRQCTVCGSRNADDAVFCSTCGATFATTQPPQALQVSGTPTKPVPIVKTITPLAQSPPPPMAVPRTQMTMGSCFYHPELPATYVCARCGRTICFSCTKPYGQLAMCPQCYWAIALRSGTRPYAP